jgi:hypothetical protein
VKAYPADGSPSYWLEDATGASFTVPVAPGNAWVDGLAIADAGASLAAYVFYTTGGVTSIVEFVEGGASRTIATGVSMDGGTDLYGTKLYYGGDDTLFSLDLGNLGAGPTTLFEPIPGAFDGSNDGVNGTVKAPEGLAFDPASQGTVLYEVETSGGDWRVRKITLP